RQTRSKRDWISAVCSAALELMANFDAVVTARRVRRADVEAFVAAPAHLGRRYLGRYAVCHTSGSQGQPALVVQDGPDILRGIQEIGRASRRERVCRTADDW